MCRTWLVMMDYLHTAEVHSEHRALWKPIDLNLCVYMRVRVYVCVCVLNFLLKQTSCVAPEIVVLWGRGGTREH